ncbi:hypothetical protein GCM10027612_28950 [Microbispora bryophytorum subsp. camponoti]
MLEERIGLLVLDLPGGGTATLERTEAVTRARRLATPGEDPADVIAQTHGVRHAAASEFEELPKTAAKPAAPAEPQTTPRPAPAPTSRPAPAQPSQPDDAPARRRGLFRRS